MPIVDMPGQGPRRSTTEEKRLRAMAVDSAARVVAGTLTSGNLTHDLSFTQIADQTLKVADQLIQWIENSRR
jgi:hypothetical protein